MGPDNATQYYAGGCAGAAQYCDAVIQADNARYDAINKNVSSAAISRSDNAGCDAIVDGVHCGSGEPVCHGVGKTNVHIETLMCFCCQMHVSLKIRVLEIK